MDAVDSSVEKWLSILIDGFRMINYYHHKSPANLIIMLRQ